MYKLNTPCLQVMVKMTDVGTKHEWMWPRQKFLDRKCIMSEIYDKFEDGETVELPPVNMFNL